MNDLEALQEVWRRLTPSFDEKDHKEISGILSLKSKSLVSRLRQSVWFELTVTVIAGILLLGYVLTAPQETLQSTLLSIIALFCIFIYIYARKLWLLRHFENSQGTLRENIGHVVTKTRSYIRFFYRSYIVLYPLFYCLTLVFIAIDMGWDNFVRTFLTPSFLIDLVVFLGVYAMVALWLTRWYLQRLFGDYLSQLELILDDLTKLEEHPRDDDPKGHF